MEEIWKDIPGYEGHYQASNLGRIKSLCRFVTEKNTNRIRPLQGKVLIPSPNPKGYLGLALSKNGKVKQFRVHKIIAKVFIPNPNQLPEVNHIDENKNNNMAANLEWCDHYYNIMYGTNRQRLSAVLKGRPRIDLAGENSVTAKLKNEQVISIYKDNRKYSEISLEYNIAISTISQIKHKTRWRHILTTI